MAEQTATEQELVQIVNSYYQESENFFRSRRMRNLRNREAYDGEQDWSHKIPGQSTEFIPKTSQTVEQMVAFLKRGLTQFGDWFSIELGKGAPISNDAARAMLREAFARMPSIEEGEHISFVTVLTDALKSGLLETEMIFKVHGYQVHRNVPSVEEGEALTRVDLKPWTLKIDSIPYDLYNRDPTGRGLYRIHRVVRDYHQVLAMAERGEYDIEVVRRIKDQMDLEEEKERDKQQSDVKLHRRSIVLDECWGTLIGRDGEVKEEKVLLTIANQKHLIRPPTPYPFWHESHPFVEIPIIRRPFSVIHRALYDEVVPLNIALNELFNLMLDGGISSVWGVRQVRPSYLEDPSEISDGIPQNKTLVLNDTAPPDAKAIERVTEGEVPPDAMAMFNVLVNELNGAAKTNEINLGLLPPKQVRATEVVEASQNSAVVLDSIVSDVEAGIEKIIRKAWLVMLQNADELSTGDLQESLTRREQLALARMTEPERYAKMGAGAKFRVNGLSATLAKARDFQKIMALLQLAQQNPILFNAFIREYSGPKILAKVIRVLNINPEEIRRGGDEDGETEVQNVMGMIGLLNPRGSQVSEGATGEPGLPSEINQQMKPSQVA